MKYDIKLERVEDVAGDVTHYIHKNDLTDIPAAACGFCGGWHSMGGMSHHCNDTTPVLGRTGCSAAHGSHCVTGDAAREEARTTSYKLVPI